MAPSRLALRREPAPLTVKRVPPSTGPAAGNTSDTEGSAWYMYGPPTKSSSAELSVRLTTAARGTPPGASRRPVACVGGREHLERQSLASGLLGTPSKVSRASPAGWRSTIRLTVGSAGLRHS